MSETCLSGIYLIICTKNNYVYVGQTHNVQNRIKHHQYMLSKGSHHNRKLQEDYCLYGWKNFVVQFVESHVDIDTRLEAEKYWIKNLRYTYNNSNDVIYAGYDTWEINDRTLPAIFAETFGKIYTNLEEMAKVMCQGNEYKALVNTIELFMKQEHLGAFEGTKDQIIDRYRIFENQKRNVVSPKEIEKNKIKRLRNTDKRVFDCIRFSVNPLTILKLQELTNLDSSQLVRITNKLIKLELIVASWHGIYRKTKVYSHKKF